MMMLRCYSVLKENISSNHYSSEKCNDAVKHFLNMCHVMGKHAKCMCKNEWRRSAEQ